MSGPFRCATWQDCLKMPQKRLGKLPKMMVLVMGWVNPAMEAQFQTSIQTIKARILSPRPPVAHSLYHPPAALHRSHPHPVERVVRGQQAAVHMAALAAAVLSKRRIPAIRKHRPNL